MSSIYKVFKSLRTALMVLAGILAFASSSLADDVFTVSGVKVDVKAENAVAAREKAFASAQTVAFTALAVRLLGEDDAKTYKIPDVATISTMIKDFEITNERLSAVEYIGTYTFRFEGSAVRSRFNMQGMKYSDVASKPVLVLPFHQVGQKIVLWQDDNPWLKAWGRNEQKGGLVPVTVPMGDVQDVADITDDQALTYRADALTQMLSRYSANEGIILLAKPGPVDAGNVPVDLSVMIYRTDHDTPEYVQTLKITPDPNGTADTLYDKAVHQVRSTLQKNWKAKTMVDPAQATNYNVSNNNQDPNGGLTSVTPYNPAGGNSMVTVHVQFTTMQEWIATRQALQAVPGITEMKVRSVTPREAQVDLQFPGGIDRLRTVLAQNDMTLTAPMGSSGGQGYSLSLKKSAGY